MVRLPRALLPTTILLLGVSLLFSSCAFLTGDIFPSWLSFVDARFDLRGEIHDFSSGNLDDPDTVYVEYLRIPNGSQFIAVLLFYNSTGRLILLDSDYMRPLARIESTSFSPFLAAGSNSDIVCGQISIDPSDFTDTTGPSSGLGNGSRQWLARTAVTASDQLVLGFDSSTLYLSRYKYSSDWTSLVGSNTTTTWSTDYPWSSWELLDADTSVSGVGVNILFRTSWETDPIGYVAYYDSTNTLDTGTIYPLSYATQVTGPFRVDEDSAWVTSGGPVAFIREDNKPDRLVRYKFGTGSTTYDSLTSTFSYVYSTELDSVIIDSNDTDVLSFDPEGEFWFVYDKDLGHLYKLRTWWK